MKVSYKKLWMQLIQKDITKSTLRKDLGFSTSTMSKLNKGEEVSLSVLLRLCDYLNCDIGDICEAIRVTTNKVPYLVHFTSYNSIRYSEHLWRKML